MSDRITNPNEPDPNADRTPLEGLPCPPGPPGHAAEPSLGEEALEFVLELEQQGQFQADLLAALGVKYLPTASPRPRYKILEHLGRGGFGCVYRADDDVLKEPAAIKVVVRTAGFVVEALTTARLDPTYSASVYDYGEERGFAWFAMKYINGPTLAEEIAQKGPLPWEQVKKVCKDILEALRDAHGKDGQGQVHRDLKPSNVMLDLADNTWKVVDWGLARPLSPKGVASNCTRDGTRNYLAPECWEEPPRYSPKSDLYALGVMIIEMLTGKDILDRNLSLPQVCDAHRAGKIADALNGVPGLPEEARRIVARATALDPRQRYATAKELLQDLGCEQRRAPRDRRHWLIAPLAAVVLLLALGLGWVHFFRHPSAVAFEVSVSLEKARETQVLADGLRDKDPEAALDLYRQALVALEPGRARPEVPDELRDRLTTLHQQLSAAVAETTEQVARRRLKVSGMDVWLTERAGQKVVPPRTVNAEKVLPLRPGDFVQITAKLSQGRDCYFYLIWIDSTRECQPAYPPGWKWKQLPRKEQRGHELVYPAAGADVPLEDSPAGLETILLLARDRPLTLQDSLAIEKLLQAMNWNQPEKRDNQVVYLDNGKPSKDYGVGGAARQLDDPVSQTKRVMEEMLKRKLADYTYAVCYPFGTP